MSSPPSTPQRTRPSSYSSPSPSGTATPSHLFLTPTRSNDPFLRSQLPEQVLYSSGEAPNRMSVFGFLSSQPPPPLYNNPPLSRRASSSYKAPLDIQPSPLSSHPLPPPPSYQPKSVEKDGDVVEGAEGGERPSMSEPPRYDSQAEREKAEERRRNRDSIVKDKMVETSSDGVLENTDTGEKEARREIAPTSTEDETGCCGCLNIDFGNYMPGFWNVLSKKPSAKNQNKV